MASFDDGTPAEQQARSLPARLGELAESPRGLLTEPTTRVPSWLRRDPIQRKASTRLPGAVELAPIAAAGVADAKLAPRALIDHPPTDSKPVSREAEPISCRAEGAATSVMEAKERAMREALTSVKTPQRAVPTPASPWPEVAPHALPDDIRGDLEAATGRSLAHVRVHSGTEGNAKAAAHGVRAIAIGSDIFMAEGQLAPATDEGRELIAHEVAHVVQAATHSSSDAPAERDPIEAAEVEADVFAARFRKRGGSMKWQPSVGVRNGTAMRAPAAGATTARITPAEEPEHYLAKHRVQLWWVVESYLHHIELPPQVRG